MVPNLLALDGTWQLLPLDRFRQGFYPGDDAAWLTQDLPAHWQQHQLLARYAGKLVYRRRFAAAPDPAARHWLRLEGAFYWSQPYLNGVDLGRHEGYFAPQEHEVTAHLAAANELVVEVECPDEEHKTGKRLITGIFSHWDAMDPDTNPGGIWRGVALLTTGPVRLREVLLHTEAAGTDRAELRYCATLDSDVDRDATLIWTFAPRNFAGQVQTIEQRRAVPAGAHEAAGLLSLRDPQLWWTHDLGFPHLYDVTLTVTVDHAPSDAQTFGFGVREFSMQEWIPYLNGVRLFIKGNNLPPGDVRLATMTPARFAADIQLAIDCHMNMLRVHGHVSLPALYDAADAAGILLWQDFPLHWLYRRSVLPEAARQVALMVRMLYNHPSVAIWCMHNEPIYVTDTKDERAITTLRTYVSSLIYSWNRDVMDTELQRVAERCDPTRPVVRSSGEFAVPLWRDGTDSHFYYGWYTIYGRLRQWEPLVRRFPKLIRFVTEFGAQSFPNLESSRRFIGDDIAQLDEAELTGRYQLQPDAMAVWMPWRQSASLAELVELTQRYQSEVNRFYIDRLRAHKYRPTGGIVPFLFHDANPAVTWSVVDYWRVPKRSYFAMQLAFSPQYVFTLVDADRYAIGASVNLPIMVVNDAHRQVPLELDAHLTDPVGATVARIRRELTLPADCMAMELERLRLTPERAGTYTLTLRWTPDGGDELINSYVVIVG